MGKLYNNDFSQTTISRFEALNLSFKNMCKLKPLLHKWLEDADALSRNSAPLSSGGMGGDLGNKRRKKRTSIDATIRVALEKSFLGNSKPTSEDISLIADNLNMEKEVRIVGFFWLSFVFVCLFFKSPFFFFFFLSSRKTMQKKSNKKENIRNT